MNAFNRVFAVLIGLLWIAACAGVLYLMWEPAREIDFSRRYVEGAFDITISGDDRILATIGVGIAMLFGLGLVLAQAMPSRRRSAPVTASGDPRYRELNERLEHLQRRVDERDGDRRPVSPQEPVLAHEGGPYDQPRRRWSLLGRDRR